MGSFLVMLVCVCDNQIFFLEGCRLGVANLKYQKMSSVSKNMGTLQRARPSMQYLALRMASFTDDIGQMADLPVSSRRAATQARCSASYSGHLKCVVIFVLAALNAFACRALGHSSCTTF